MMSVGKSILGRGYSKWGGFGEKGKGYIVRIVGK